MPHVISNGIRIAYEDHGDANDPVILMIQGLGMPLAAWPPKMVEFLLAKGFRVILFDNRDVGQSEYLDHFAVPNVVLQALRRQCGLKVNAPYQLTDMMRDAHGLLDALDIDAAHVLGVSMGGMISQLLAIHEPTRVISLTSIMSTTGNRKLPGPTSAVRRLIMRGPAGTSREHRIDYHRRLWRLIGSPGFPREEAELEAFLERIYERGMRREGTARQTLAVLASGDRVADLRKLRIPSLVIHGDADPLVQINGGRDTAAAIPNSKLEVIAGMGHDLPAVLLPRMVELVASHAAKAVNSAVCVTS